MPATRVPNIAAQTSRALQRTVAKVARLQRKKKAWKRKHNGQQTRYNKLDKRFKGFTHDKSCLELRTSGKTGKRLMNTSQLALGLRRNLSNCAASDFGVTIMRDLAATTVLRAECKTGSALNAAMKAFCEDGLALMRQPAAEIEQEPQEPQELDLSNSEQPWSLSVIRIRCDATNSSIWKREELHVVEVVASFLYSSIKLIAGKHTDCKSFMTTRPCLHLGLMSNLDFCQFSLIITTSPLTPLLNYSMTQLL